MFNNPDKQIKALQKQIAELEKKHGPEAIELSDPLDELAALYIEMEDFPAALAVNQRVLAIQEKAYGSDHPDIGIALADVADIHMVMDNHAEARDLYRRVLTIDEKNYGNDHPEVAVDCINLSSALVALDELDEALELLRRAIKIDENYYGPDNPEVAADLNNLANTLHMKGDNKAALEAYARSLALFQATGMYEEQILVTHHNMAGVLQDNGELEAAREHLEAALALEHDLNGENAPGKTFTFNALGLVLADTEDYSGAQEAYEKGLAIIDAQPQKDPMILSVQVMLLNNLATTFMVQKKYPEARQHLNQGMELLNLLAGDVPPEEHPDPQVPGMLLHNLGQVFMEEGMAENAHSHLQQAYDFLIQVLEEDDPLIENIQFLLQQLDD